MIEKYGTGIQRILSGFADYGLPEPHFEEIAGGFRVTVYSSMKATDPAGETPYVTEQVTDDILKLIAFCVKPKTRKELMEHLGVKHREHFRSAILGKALQLALVEQTIPDKPRSRFQKYRLTAKGKGVLEKKILGKDQ